MKTRNRAATFCFEVNNKETRALSLTKCTTSGKSFTEQLFKNILPKSQDRVVEPLHLKKLQVVNLDLYQ